MITSEFNVFTVGTTMVPTHGKTVVDGDQQMVTKHLQVRFIVFAFLGLFLNPGIFFSQLNAQLLTTTTKIEKKNSQEMSITNQSPNDPSNFSFRIEQNSFLLLRRKTTFNRCSSALDNKMLFGPALGVAVLPRPPESVLLGTHWYVVQ